MSRKSSRHKLKALAAFDLIFTRQGFVFSMPPTSQDGEPLSLFSTSLLSPKGEEFLEMVIRHGWVLPRFDWPTWAKTEEAARLRDDPAALAQATAEQLSHLLTVLARQEHFGCDAMTSAFRSGLLNRIVRRANELARGAASVPN